VIIRLNGRDQDAVGGSTVMALIETMGLQPGRVAVELNGRVVARPDYQRAVLREGDTVEVVHFVGGG
jgi:thiamine biosynthesis protein ThiS